MIFRSILTIALVLTIAVLTPTTFDLGVRAAGSQEYVADTGVITLGPNQRLRITVAPAAGAPPADPLTFTLSVHSYGRVRCRDGVCVHPLEKLTTSNLTLAPGRAASADSDGGDYAQFRVRFGAQPHVQVNAVLIDSTTGATVGYLGGVQVAGGDIN